MSTCSIRTRSTASLPEAALGSRSRLRAPSALAVTGCLPWSPQQWPGGRHRAATASCHSSSSQQQRACWAAVPSGRGRGRRGALQVVAFKEGEKDPQGQQQQQQQQEAARPKHKGPQEVIQDITNLTREHKDSAALEARLPAVEQPQDGSPKAQGASGGAPAAAAAQDPVDLTPQEDLANLEREQKVRYPEDEKRQSSGEREARRTKREVLRQTEALQDVSDLVSREQTPRMLKEVVQAVKETAAPSYDAPAVRVSPLVPAFTRRREVFMGRTAMVGFMCTCIGEILTGKGAIAQLSLETAQPVTAITAVLTGVVIFNVIAALSPWSPTFSEQNIQDIARRPPGPPLQWVNPLTNFGQLLGISRFGFSKANEVFSGRVAMLGFFAALTNETFTGQGPLAQLSGWLGSDYTNYFLYAVALVTWTSLAVSLASWQGNMGEYKGGEDIY